MSAVLELAPEPRSVGRARVWICGELNRIGRQDLCDAAELGISELVTNALLHSDPPITVRLSGTEANPRVEVHDASATAPALRDMTRDGRETATVGRGLGIVATFSSSWGADVSETGKFVWFEPVAEAETGDGSEEGMLGDLFDIEGLLAEEALSAQEPGRCTVRLRNLPIPIVVRYQIWFEDLSRELRLLSITDADPNPVVVEVLDAVHEWTLERRHCSGLDGIEAAMQVHQTVADIDVEVPATAGESMARLLDRLQRADELCRQQRTLTLPPDPEVVELRTWYHGEFVRQIRGEPPRPWRDPGTVDHR